MKLSVIIVNYNVKHFLEQCLCSVQKAIASLPANADAEVFVIDNGSADNSIQYLTPRFPGVRFIPNVENLGFAKACNQGAKLAKGEYILFLNPDTLVPEDCFGKCISFMDATPEAGALGIKMLDGSGKFLKESRRSFPSPMTSLFKLFGLSRLFPRSGLFSRYHMGHLDENTNHEADVLAGAFMLLRKEVFEKVGGFDEVFFMYGEDVDLSYRVQKAGYKNYYFAGSCIIHFKGESTRKGSMNYVRMFYKAMSIFVRKHYGAGRARLFNSLIHIAIWLRAALTATANFLRKAGVPLIDAGLILLSFWLLKNIWNNYVRTDIHYENKLLWIAFPAYTAFYLITAYYAGLYDRWYKRSELVRATLVASIVLLAAYALLPEQYRFSRAIILFGVGLAFILISLLRWVLVRSKVLSSNKERSGQSNTLIAGSAEEYNKTVELMKDAGLQERVLGRIAVHEGDLQAVGHWKNIEKLSLAIPFKEVIYCEGTLSFSDIIRSIQYIPSGIRIKFHAAGSNSIVGSDSKDSSGEAFSKENGYKLKDPYNKRVKRLIDIVVSVTAFITFPLHLLFIKRPFQFFGHCFSVLFAQKTWVGYAMEEKNLPELRPAVLACNGVPASVRQSLPAESLHLMNFWYARDYEPMNDLKLLWRSYRRLGG
jgi:O-antigen biosynthesis protein